jgi:hypothetical protein
VTTVLLAGLRLLEHGLDAIERATERVRWRRFLRDHPDVIPHWTDGT